MATDNKITSADDADIDNDSTAEFEVLTEERIEAIEEEMKRCHDIEPRQVDPMNMDDLLDEAEIEARRASGSPDAEPAVVQTSESLASKVFDRVSAQLDVFQNSSTNASNEYPSSGEGATADAQREFVARFRRLRRKAQRRINALIDKLGRARDKIDLADAKGKLQDIPSRCEIEVLRMLADSRSSLGTSTDHADAHSQDLPQKQGVAQPIPVFIQIAFLVVLIAVCATLVAKMLIPDSAAESPVPPPWIFVVILIVITLSSVTALSVSSSISYDGAFSRLKKWFRATTGIVFVGLTSVFASHYLLAMAADATTRLSAITKAMLVERTVPILPLADWTVFAIVLIAALLAFVLCYRPKHIGLEAQSAPDTIRSATHRKSERLARKLRKQVNAKIDQAESEVSATLKRSKAAIGKYARLVDESSRLPAKLREYDFGLEDACGVLQNGGLTENSKVRTTEVPHNFRDLVWFGPEYESSLTALADEGLRLENYQQDYGDLENEARQVRQKLRDLNSRAIERLGELTKL